MSSLSLIFSSKALKKIIVKLQREKIVYFYWIASTFRYFSIWFRKPIFLNSVHILDKLISFGIAMESGSEQSKVVSTCCIKNYHVLLPEQDHI